MRPHAFLRLSRWTLLATVLVPGPSAAQEGSPEGSWTARVAAEIAAREYRFRHAEHAEAEVLAAPNRAQGFRVRIEADGARLEPRLPGPGLGGATSLGDALSEEDGTPWRLHLGTSSFGRGEDVRPLGEARVSLDGERALLERPGLLEWFVNDARGLEQGWTIPAPFPGLEEPLWIGLALGGDLVARLHADGLGASLVDAQGGVRLRYLGLRAWDADGVALEARLVAAPRGVGIEVHDAGARYPLTVDPVVNGPVWSAAPDQVGAQLGEVAPAGDVNGDGYADILVGAHAYDAGQVDEGRAFLFLGGPGGPGTMPSWSDESDQAGAHFGWRLGTAGDVNGDGYDDVVVSADRMDLGQTDEGVVFGYLGSPSGLESTPSWTVEGNQPQARFGWGLAAAGDVNGDGFSDVIVGANLWDEGEADEGKAFVYAGSAGGLATTPLWSAQANQAGAQLGYRVASAGDVDADGFDDLVVGAFHFTNGETNEGAAFVYHGSPSGPSVVADWQAEGDQANAEYGWSVAPAGDVNGDGYADLIVSASRYDNGQVDEGQAFVYHGSASGLSTTADWIAQGNQASAGFGSDVASAGDVNGDGFSDVLIGAALYDSPQVDEGRIFVCLGSPSGLRSVSAFVSESNQAGAQFGLSVAQLGDVDGDGRGDFMGGAPFFDQGQQDEGLVVLYLGRSDVPDLDPNPALEGNQANGLFGFSVSRAGDVNGDGFGDVLVGAVIYDAGQVDEGVAFLFSGSAGGLSSTPSWTAEGNEVNARLGWSVADAGDVNGDGYADVIVGAPEHDAGAVDGGCAYVFHGSAGGLSTSPAWTGLSSQAGAGFGRWVAGAGDVNGDGFADVLVGASTFDGGQADEGVVYLYLGSPAGVAGSPAWSFECDQAGARLGEAADTAGDVDRDGFLDVVTGAPLFDDAFADEGRIWVHLGSAGGLATAAAWSFDGNRASANLGTSAATAGDVNGDGFSDVVSGAPGLDAELFGFHGSPSGPSLAPDWNVAGTFGERLGESLSDAGDVNGDGFGDVIAGANFYSNGQPEEGGAFLYLGSSSGLATSPAWSGESNQPTGEYGWAVSGAGDVDGDGFADLVIGSFNYTNGQTNEGHAFVYLGNDATGGQILTPRQLRVGSDDPIGFQGASDSPDFFRIRVVFEASLAGVGWASPGEELAFLEWEVKPFGKPFDGTNLRRSAAGQVVAPLGPPLVFDELASRPGFGTGLYRWRARIATTNPLYPHSAWFTSQEGTLTEARLRFPPRSGSIGGTRRRR